MSSQSKAMEQTFIILPRSVCELKGLEWPAKVVWAEVYSFSRQGRPCWLTLAELGRRCQRSTRQVSQYLAQLQSMGLLEVTNLNGRSRQLYAREPGSEPLPMKPTSMKPTSSKAVQFHPDTRPTSTQGRGERLPNKKQEKNNKDERTQSKPRDLQEVRNYFEEIKQPDGEALQFFDYWTSAGWRRKGGAIKDWKAAARTWARQPYRNSGGNREGRQLDAGAALKWASS